MARREDIPHFAVLPCLLTTFLFGPAGYLLFQLVRASHRAGMAGTVREATATPLGRLALARLAEDSPRYTRLAVLLSTAMLPLLGAFALDTRLFQGINVWIKPLKFLFSLTIYVTTLAFFARYTSAAIKRRPWWRWHERAVVLSVMLEVIWIGTAAALATSSHFNRTPIGTSIYALMGMLATLLTTASTSLSWAILRHPAGNLAPAVRTGLVWGLGLTLPLTLMTAQTMASMGSHWVGGTASDADGLWVLGWSQDGGDLRVAHFFGTHAMYVVPFFAWCSSLIFGREARTPVRIVALTYVVFVIVTFVQGLMGNPFLTDMRA